MMNKSDIYMMALKSKAFDELRIAATDENTTAEAFRDEYLHFCITTDLAQESMRELEQSIIIKNELEEKT